MEIPSILLANNGVSVALSYADAGLLCALVEGQCEVYAAILNNPETDEGVRQAAIGWVSRSHGLRAVLSSLYKAVQAATSDLEPGMVANDTSDHNDRLRDVPDPAEA
jgi:hypothetical protein